MFADKLLPIQTHLS